MHSDKYARCLFNCLVPIEMSQATSQIQNLSLTSLNQNNFCSLKRYSVFDVVVKFIIFGLEF
jgi:hypothetical protein